MYRVSDVIIINRTTDNLVKMKNQKGRTLGGACHPRRRGTTIVTTYGRSDRGLAIVLNVIYDSIKILMLHIFISCYAKRKQPKKKKKRKKKKKT